jgi:hypothetical protein
MADLKITQLPVASVTTNDVVPFAKVSTSVTSGTTFIDLKTQVQTAPTITTPSLVGAVTHNSFGEYTAIANPSAAPAGNMRFYARNVSGRIMPKWIGPAGAESPVQPAIFNNNIALWTANASAAGATIGPGWFTPTGNFASVNSSFTLGSIYTTVQRARYTNVATTSVQAVGPRMLGGTFITSSVANVGGFFFFARWGIEQAHASFPSIRAFVGLGNNASVVSASISSGVNLAGFGWDTGDNSVMSFIHNDNAGAPSKINITTKVSVLSGYDSYIYSRAGSSSVLYFRLDDVNSASIIAQGSVVSDIPINHVPLFAQAAVSNTIYGQNSVVGIGVNKIYVETDL